MDIYLEYFYGFSSAVAARDFDSSSSVSIFTGWFAENRPEPVRPVSAVPFATAISA